MGSSGGPGEARKQTAAQPNALARPGAAHQQQPASQQGNPLQHCGLLQPGAESCLSFWALFARRPALQVMVACLRCTPSLPPSLLLLPQRAGPSRELARLRAELEMVKAQAAELAARLAAAEARPGP